MENIWNKFLDLLPDSPKVIGDVLTVSNGNYVVQLLGGGTIRATATEVYSENQRVFVVDGKIDGKAPTLTLENIIV
jgi:hypothetical protein